MKRFLVRLMLYAVLLSCVLMFSLLAIPYKKVAGSTLLFSLLDKHTLLRDAKSPRLIFVGGSNLSFGLDSERISREYRMEVVNMAIHGAIGLRYMVNDIKPFIREDDIVVVIPEYDQFEGMISYGGQELLCVLFDIYPDGKAQVGPRQWVHLSRFLPTYAASKLTRWVSLGARGLFRKETPTHFGIYDRDAFNRHGDAVAHWSQENVQFAPQAVEGKINVDCVSQLNEFAAFVRSTGAHVYFLYPCYQLTSFRMSSRFIDALDSLLHERLLFPILSTPTRYALPDHLCFNTPYHLNKAGVDLRTQRIIEDLKPIL